MDTGGRYDNVPTTTMPEPEYEDRHRYGRHRPERWVRTSWYCLICGKQDVWQSTEDSDDYYTRYCCTCKSCGHEQLCVDRWEPQS